MIDGLYRDVERRIAASPPGLCPVDLAMNFLNLCHAQTCGKCVPCRVGLGQLSDLMESVLDGKATMETIALIERTARVIVNSADCAIGRDAARLVLDGIQGFRDDYEEHVLRHRCLGGMQNPVPCVALCPAGVDIPGYTVLVKYGRYADAVRLIRQDNPFPSACAYICEHPCEARCRRNMIDDAVNIRGLKRYAVDHAGYVPHPACAEETGKMVAIVGGGPSGLSAAYYLALMGHKVTVYEKRAKLGGMLRYGIPAYRLPREILDAEIASLLSVGIDAKVNVDIGDEITFDELRSRYDALYLALGAHTDKKTGIEGEDAEGVMSAVEMLREIGDDHMPDFRGKEIVVIGGGNVAMDVCRSAVRLGARKVSCVYRRRREDMTALPEEVEGAVAEGVELVTLQAPVRIETNGQGHAVALWTQPQIIGEMDDKGRPKPEKAKLFEKRIAADGIVVAIGQGVETHGFEQSKITIKRGAFVAEASGQIDNMDGVFAGGDCVTGPATVIRAIAAGKVAAVVFGATGGVMDAALRSAYYLVTGENPDPDAFTAVRGMDGWKEASFTIPTAGEVKVAVVSGLGNARKLLYALERGEVSYDFVEVMACLAARQGRSAALLARKSRRAGALSRLSRQAPRREITSSAPHRPSGMGDAAGAERTISKRKARRSPRFSEFLSFCK